MNTTGGLHMNKTIIAIYTGKGLADPLQAVINRTLPDWRLVSIIDAVSYTHLDVYKRQLKLHAQICLEAMYRMLTAE